MEKFIDLRISFTFRLISIVDTCSYIGVWNGTLTQRPTLLDKKLQQLDAPLEAVAQGYKNLSDEELHNEIFNSYSVAAPCGLS